MTSCIWTAFRAGHIVFSVKKIIKMNISSRLSDLRFAVQTLSTELFGPNMLGSDLYTNDTNGSENFQQHIRKVNSIEGNSLLLEPVVCDSGIILFARNIKDCYFSHSMEKELRFRRDVTWMTRLPSQASNPKESAAYPELNFITIRCR